MEYNQPSLIVKDLNFGDEAKQKIIKGVDKLAKAVKSTKTDVDDQLFSQVATAIRKREVKADDFVS